MTDLQYNFLDDNFTTFENVESPKVLIQMPLMDDPVDISNWATGVTKQGIPVVKNNTEPKMIINNNEEVPIIKESSVTQQRGNLQENKKKAMEFFQSKGLNAHAAAGIVGNLMTESNLITDKIGDNGTSYGLAQWHDEKPGKGRWTNLKNFAKSKGTHESDLNTQLEFLWHELSEEKRFSGLINQLNNSRNSDEATLLFMNKFEVPSEKAKLQSSKKRRQNAVSCLV